MEFVGRVCYLGRWPLIVLSTASTREEIRNRPVTKDLASENSEVPETVTDRRWIHIKSTQQHLKQKHHRSLKAGSTALFVADFGPHHRSVPKLDLP